MDWAISCWVMIVCSGAASATGTGVPMVGLTISWLIGITGGGGAFDRGGGGGSVCILMTRPVYAASSGGCQTVVSM